MQITRATSLAEVYRTLRPYPLSTPEEIAAFYRDEINATRGGDKMKRLRLRLSRAAEDGLPFKACLMGHSGVGKSTELSRLQETIKDQFRVIRFSANNDLDPGSFRPLDVVLVMMMEVATQTARLVAPPPEARLQEIKDWFAAEQSIRQETIGITGSITAGVGAERGSLWDQVLGLFATLQGEVKYASTRNKKIEEYRLSRIKDLIDVANRLLDDCSRLLRYAYKGQRWLFIGEDFDKAGIAAERIEELFMTYGNLFQDLRASLIFNVPIGLFYSSDATRLPFANENSFVLPDTPIYKQNHSPNAIGREAVKAVLTARIDLSLIESQALERLIIASGGNLRDLFSLVNYAADTALLREAEVINGEDANAAILDLRSDYERRLGMSPFDPEEITYSEKAELLVRIYNGEQDAQITEPALYSLLRARAVQEFNGQRWFGVHPLVVDILAKQGRLQAAPSGGVPGGT
ncbi:MAG: hypothetical protein HC812_12775 [Leptolyngbya sp. RL_3_1]|nr:hypothetical protein [Leptolyngbya sp. RL_3_1]